MVLIKSFLLIVLFPLIIAMVRLLATGNHRGSAWPLVLRVIVCSLITAGLARDLWDTWKHWGD